MPRKISRGHPSKEPSLLNYERCEKKGWHSVPPIPSCSSRTFTNCCTVAARRFLPCDRRGETGPFFQLRINFDTQPVGRVAASPTQTKECSEPTYTLRFGLRALRRASRDTVRPSSGHTTSIPLSLFRVPAKKSAEILPSTTEHPAKQFFGLCIISARFDRKTNKK